MFFNLKKNKTNYTEGAVILLRHLMRYRNELFLVSVFTIVSAIADAVVPYLAGKIFDSLIGAHYEIFWWILGFWVVVRIISDVLSWRINLLSDKLEAIMEVDYYIHAIGKLLELPMSFHKNQKIGEILNRFYRAGGQMSAIGGRVFIFLAPQILSVVIALGIIFTVQYKLASILVGAVIVYIALTIFITPQMAALFKSMHKAYNKAYGDASDAVYNVATVKQGNAESYEKRKLSQNFRSRAVKYWSDVATLQGGLRLSQRILVSLAQASIFLYSLALIMRGDLTIGELVMFNGYAAMLFGPFTTLANQWHLIQNGLTALVRAEKVIRTPSEPYNSEHAIILAVLGGDVVFEKVCFSYKKENPILLNVSFSAQSGETVALVGESGVGKSTLIDLISRYYDPDKGRVLVGGHDVKTLDLETLRSQIGIVPQEVMLFNDTVKKNITYGSFGVSEEKMRRAARLAHIDMFIESLPRKYAQLVGERGIKLSVGQKQRIAIARAILRDPKILVLDELTSALDAKSEKLIQELLAELMRGRTTFVIAHRLSTVRKAGTILVIEKGRIIESGTHEALLALNGSYAKFYTLQFSV